MAYFIRTRRLDLGRLERKPQESLEVVHAILDATVKEVLDKLGKVERGYYGPGKGVHDELKKWRGSLKNILSCGHQSTFISADQINDILRQAGDPVKKFKFDMYDLNKLKECFRKVNENIPSKFSEVVMDLKALLKYMEKYCLSFYELEDAIQYETARNYEKKRVDTVTNIRERLKSLNEMIDKFQTDKFLLSDLSSFGIELSRKGDCAHAPFLLIFPECCEHIKMSCAGLLTWIEQDGSYDTYVQNDIKDYEENIQESLKVVRDYQQKYFQLSFRHKQIQADCERLGDDLKRLEAKDDELTVQEEMMSVETNEMQQAIETKEFRRDALIKNAAVLHPQKRILKPACKDRSRSAQVLYEKYSELSEELRDLKRDLPFKKRQLLNIKYKLGWICDKKRELDMYRRKVDEVQQEMEEIEMKKQEEEIQHEVTMQILEKAKQIHLFKSTPDAVTKIYHEQPVEVNKARLPGNRGKHDPFERACQFVCENIELDWPRLYRALPFYPPRGTNTVDADIKEFTSVGSRIPLDKVAKKALHRWRRFHTRAKLDDLHVALSTIKRHDLLHDMEMELNPPQAEPEPEGDYSYVEDYLIPYVKQVEKFDQLKATGRITL